MLYIVYECVVLRHQTHLYIRHYTDKRSEALGTTTTESIFTMSQHHLICYAKLHKNPSQLISRSCTVRCDLCQTAASVPSDVKITVLHNCK